MKEQREGQSEIPSLPTSEQKKLAESCGVRVKVKLTDGRVGVIERMDKKGCFHIQLMDEYNEPIEGKTLIATAAHLAEKLED